MDRFIDKFLVITVIASGSLFLFAGVKKIKNYVEVKKFIEKTESIVEAKELGNVSPSNEIKLTRKYRIAVLDTGVDFSHPYLEPFKVEGQVNEEDFNGHGTHVAGIIAQNLNLLLNNRASEYVEIVSYKYTNNGQNRLSADLLTLSIHRAVEQGADMINISSSGRGFNPDEYRAIQAASLKGIIVVAAAGNDSSSAPAYPCSYDLVNIICVGNLDRGSIAPSSNYGKKVTVFVEGTNVYSTYPQKITPNGWVYLSGTSMAAPVVSAQVIYKQIVAGQYRSLVHAYQALAPFKDESEHAKMLGAIKDMPLVHEDPFAEIGE